MSPEQRSSIERHAKAALALQPGRAADYVALGDVAALAGQHQEANDYYRQAAEIAPNVVRALKVGLNSLAMGDQEAALASWREFGVENTDLVHLGEREQLRDQAAPALRWYELAALLDPQRSSSAHVHSAALLSEQRDWTAAQSHYEQALAVDGGWGTQRQEYDALVGSAQVLREIAKQQRAERDNAGSGQSLGQALPLVDRAAELSTPEDRVLLFLRGQIYLDQGDTASAATQFQQIVDLDTTDTTAFLYLGFAHYPQDPERAVEMFARAAQLDASESTTETVCDYLGRREDENAVRSFQTLVLGRMPTADEQRRCLAGRGN